MFCVFKRNHDCTSYSVYIFKWTINENCSQLFKKKKKTVLQRQTFPDVSWRSHCQKLMARKLSKHRSNKEKISSRHVKSAPRRASAMENFGISTRVFLMTISHACEASAIDWKNSSPHINATELMLHHDLILPNAFLPLLLLSTKRNTIFDETGH